MLVARAPNLFAISDDKNKVSKNSKLNNSYERIKVLDASQVDDFIENSTQLKTILKNSQYSISPRYPIKKIETIASSKWYTYNFYIINSEYSTKIDIPVNIVFTSVPWAAIKKNDLGENTLNPSFLRINDNKLYSSDQLVSKLKSALISSNNLPPALVVTCWSLLELFSSPLSLNSSFNLTDIIEQLDSIKGELNSLGSINNKDGFSTLTEEDIKIAFDKYSILIGKNFSEILTALTLLNLSFSKEIEEGLKITKIPSFAKFPSSAKNPLVDVEFFDSQGEEQLEISTSSLSVSTKFKQGAAFSISAILPELDRFVPHTPEEKLLKELFIDLSTKTKETSTNPNFKFINFFKYLTPGLGFPLISNYCSKIARELSLENKQLTLNSLDDFFDSISTTIKNQTEYQKIRIFKLMKKLSEFDIQLSPSTNFNLFFNSEKNTPNDKRFKQELLIKKLIYMFVKEANNTDNYCFILINKILKSHQVHQINFNIDKGVITFKLNKFENLNFYFYWKGLSNNINIVAKK